MERVIFIEPKPVPDKKMPGITPVFKVMNWVLVVIILLSLVFLAWENRQDLITGNLFDKCQFSDVFAGCSNPEPIETDTAGQM